VFHPGPPADYKPLGDIATGSLFRMEVHFSPLGAGIASIDLTDHFVTLKRTDHERLQSFHPHPVNPNIGVAPFALDAVEINGQVVRLFGDSSRPGTYWTETAPGTFQAIVNGPDGSPALKITREYRLEQGSYDLVLNQRAENVSGAPMKIVWCQFGPADLEMGLVRYGGDRRRIRFGYLTSPQADPSQQIVRAKEFLIERTNTLGKPTAMNQMRVWVPKTLWPNPVALQKSLTPVWIGMTNRHFAVALHTLVDPNVAAAASGAGIGVRIDKVLTLAGTVDQFVMDSPSHTTETVVVYLKSHPVTLASGQAGALNAAIYAGPLSDSFMTEKREPRAWLVGLPEIVVYTLGGPCGFCTFQWLTHPLRNFLGFLHDNVLFDYSLAIIFLVVCVRTILHPVTKWSQVNMMRFSKQMQALAPKQKKIQEKYKNDPMKMREEMGRLMREESISYKGLLGCVPPFLQSPIWIALYAMLYFMFELRHTPAFFGVFQAASQAIAGVEWAFLADLSEPDHFIPIGTSFNIPIIGLVDSINILPILLGVIFYIQQKYLTPPPASPLTPEQEQQQKIVKVMMVVMFPVMMYNTPSALVLYFIANSTLGIFESRYIRRHIDRYEASNKDVITTPGGQSVINRKGKEKAKPGFMQRMMQMAEERAKQVEQAKKRGKQ